MGFLPSAFCSWGDPELGAGCPLFNECCSGLGWPEITQGKEETRNPGNLMCLPSHGGGYSCQDTTSMCGVVCRLRGWDGGWEARPWVEPLYGRGMGGTLPPVGGAGGRSFGDRIPAWVGDHRVSHAGRRPSVSMVIISRVGIRGEEMRTRLCPRLRAVSHPHFRLLLFCLHGYQSLLLV